MRINYLLVILPLSVVFSCNNHIDTNEEKNSDKKSFENLYELSQEYVNNQEYGNSIEVLLEAKKYAKDFSDSNNVNIDLFDSYLNLNDFESAKECLPLYKNQNSESFWNLYTYAIFYYRFEKFNLATSYAMKSLEQLPEENRRSLDRSLKHIIVQSFSKQEKDSELLRCLRIWRKDLSDLKISFRESSLTVEEVITTLENEG